KPSECPQRSVAGCTTQDAVVMSSRSPLGSATTPDDRSALRSTPRSRLRVSMAEATVGYLSADVIAETCVSESYLSFLVRTGIVRPGKHRNGRTNIFSANDVELVRWAIARRGELTIEEMQIMVSVGMPR